ncbi:hypothetical protein [Polymorphospora sp. NPDC050346]|uniref:hypothetical protein n=1 Tax=Polymorphospora sp. NPDC050346 TaxID=3155780 RepID=UPI0033DC0F7D
MEPDHTPAAQFARLTTQQRADLAAEVFNILDDADEWNADTTQQLDQAFDRRGVTFTDYPNER